MNLLITVLPPEPFEVQHCCDFESDILAVAVNREWAKC